VDFSKDISSVSIDTGRQRRQGNEPREGSRLKRHHPYHPRDSSP